MRRLCAVYAVNPTDREDLFQDIFLAVWKSLPNFRGDSSERTWLYSVAHNVALTWQVRDRRHRRRHEVLDEAQSQAGMETDPRRIALYELIAQLATVDRQLVTLWLEGLSLVEIGEIAGMRPNTVAVRLTRIRQHLTEAFQISEARNG
jgi:RNA polymerase sigma-70 factor (ECF subfamily)